jgi:hypothetical protein
MLGEKAAERYALRASDVMSELKLRPPNPYGEKCGRACDPGSVKARTLQKSKSAAPEKTGIHFDSRVSQSPESKAPGLKT